MNANELNVPCLATLAGSSTCVAFHPTAPLLATGSDDTTVKLWQLSDNSALTCVATLTGHDGQVYSVAFDPTGTLLATGSSDGTAKLWRLSADGATFVATCVATLGGHGGQVYSVAFHPTARLLATGSEDSTAKLWRLSADGATCVATLDKSNEGRPGLLCRISSNRAHSGNRRRRQHCKVVAAVGRRRNLCGDSECGPQRRICFTRV